MAQMTEGWYLCAFSLAPVMAYVAFSSKRKAFFALTVFMTVYHGILCAFLLALYDYPQLPTVLTTLLCIAAALLLTAFQSGIMLLAVYPSLSVRSGAFSKAVCFAACFAAGQFVLEIMPYLAFPWARLENSLAFQPLLLQSAALLGGCFTAFLILLFNAFVTFMVRSVIFERLGPACLYACLAALLFSLNLAGGALYIANKESGQPISVAAVQDETEGFAKDSQPTGQAVAEYAKLIQELPYKPELVLLPETAVAGLLTDEYISALENAAGADTAVVTGCIYQIGGKRYNCLMPIDSEKERHLKSILVPVGEYTPFVDLEGMPQLTPSESSDSISVRGRRCAALICIESIFSTLLGPQIESGAQIVLIPTNDSWFKNSYARQVHFRHSIVRAIEYDRFAVRSGNCGISAVIDRNGFILACRETKKKGAVMAQAELVSDRTPYSLTGNIFVFPVLVFILWFYTRRLLVYVLDRLTGVR